MSVIPPDVSNLTEETSLKLVSQMQSFPLPTELSPQAIATTYVRQGQGSPPMLLLHGFDSSLLEFRRLLPQLTPSHETWAVDLLGFGFTERRLGVPIDAIAIKTHLYAFWQSLIQRPVVLVGASMGGATALDFTLTYPEAVSHLVLVDSAGLTRPPLTSFFMFKPFDTIATDFLRSRKIREAIARSSYFDPKWASDDAYHCASLHLDAPRWQAALIAFTKSGGYGSFVRQLPNIQVPTLILWGENDRILGKKVPHKFKKLIPQSQLQWIAECGHVPHLEKPEITAEKIMAWLGSNPERQKA
jgi:pimeloyl-ACP methyl ester carboxylesterase